MQPSRAGERKWGYVDAWRIFVLIATILFTSIIAWPADLTLDLTKRSPGNDDSFGGPGQSYGASIPGRTVGGIIDHHVGVPAATQLPFEVTLNDFWPLAASPRGKFTVEVLVRNMGKEAIAIPASRRYADVIRSGNQDQRMLRISLELSPVGSIADNIAPVTIALGLTVGSSSIPDFSITLPPQQTLLIRADRDGLIPGADKWRDAGVNIVSVDAKAVLTEDFLEDRAFTVRKTSEGVLSRNSVHLTLDLTR